MTGIFLWISQNSFYEEPLWKDSNNKFNVVWQHLTCLYLKNVQFLHVTRIGITLHEKQHFRKNAQRKDHIFLIFHNWHKCHIFRKAKIKENIIFSIIFVIFRSKSIEQDNDQKERLNDKILYHVDERYRIALTVITLF